MRIALDAMGGDHAPGPNIDGAIDALKADPELEILLVGQQEPLDKLLEESEFNGERMRIIHAPQIVGMEEKPTDAMRKKPNSSISVCWQLMANHDVDAVVSAGNTGAVVASGLRTRLFLKGVKRPGIAVALPTLTGRSVLVDVGANPAARPEHLYQYAVMGSVYAREVLGISSPRVGLMNIGSEDGKGNELYRLTHEYLSRCRLKDTYVGNVEGRGLYHGEAEVVVCEGFVGNVILKASEGIAELIFRSVGEELVKQLQSEKETAVGALRRLANQFHYAEAGGAPLLGIDGICIICHGSSDSRSITNALKVAATFQNKQINSQIMDELAIEAQTAAG